jgi:hypothetical protein
VDALINPFGYTAVDLPLFAVRTAGTVWPASQADGPAARSSSPWPMSGWPAGKRVTPLAKIKRDRC